MKALSTFLFLLISYATFAQADYVNGYYVTPQNDTVRCFINDKNWSINPDKIQVKSALEESQAQELTPTNIKSFALSTGDLYVSETVNVDVSPVRVSEIQLGDKPVVISDTVFLRVLVRGKHSLLFLRDEKKDHYYIQTLNEKPQELKRTIYKKEENGKPVVVTQDTYKNLLTYYLSDCPEIRNRIQTTTFDAAALKKLFGKYLACSNEETTNYIATKEKVKLEPGILAGVSVVHMFFDHNDGEQSFKSTEPSYIIGASLDAILPRKQGRWSFYNELTWKPHVAKGQSRSYQSNDMYITRDSYVKMNYLGIGTMLRYRMLMKKVKLFTSIGLANNFSLKNTNDLVITHHSFSRESVIETKAFSNMKNYEFAYMAGAGMRLNKLTAELRVERSSGNSNINGFRSPKTLASFNVGYTFK